MKKQKICGIILAVLCLFVVAGCNPVAGKWCRQQPNEKFVFERGPRLHFEYYAAATDTTPYYSGYYQFRQDKKIAMYVQEKLGVDIPVGEIFFEFAYDRTSRTTLTLTSTTEISIDNDTIELSRCPK